MRPATLALCVLALCSCGFPPEPVRVRQARAALGVEANVDAPVTGVAAIHQANFATAFNGTQWMTAWSDQRMSNTGGWQVWGARVALDGGVLDPFGLQLTFGRGGDHPAVACVPAYCWIVWTDVNSFEGVRVAANGAFLDPAVVTFNGSTGVISDLSLATNGTDFFAAWTDTRSGTPAIFGKALLADGGLPAEVVISSGALARRRPVVVSLDGGYLVAWSDLRVASAHIWAVQVFDGGSALGTEAQVSTSANVDDFVSAAVEPRTGNVLITWDSAGDILGRRVRADAVAVDATPFFIDNNVGTQRHARTTFDGARWVLGYEGAAPEVRAATVAAVGGNNVAVIADGGATFPALAAAGPGTVLMAWDNLHLKSFFGNPNDGGFPEGVALTLAQSASSQFDVDVAGVDGAFLVTWQDSRTDALLPTARWFTAAGVPAGATFDLSTLPSRANRGRSVVGGPSGRALAMWLPAGGTAIEFTRLDAFGPPLDLPPLSSPGGFAQNNPSGAYGPGGWLVAFEESRASPDLSARIIPPSGSALINVVVANTTAAEVAPAVAGSMTQWLVAWSEGTSIGFTRIDALGGGQPRTLTPGVAMTRASPAVASDGTNFLIAWLDNTTAILGVRVDQNGLVLDATPLTLAMSVASNAVPSVTFDGLRYVVSWRSAAGSVLARVVPTTGAPSAVLSTLMTPAINRHSSVLAMNGGDGFVVTASNQVQAPIASARVTYNHFTESVTASPCTIELDCRTLSCVVGFCVPLDAGVDAGPGDAGLDAGLGDAGLGDAGLGDAGLGDAGLDGGPDDAGLDAGADDSGVLDSRDAGPGPTRELGVGCGCGVADPSLLIIFLAVLIRRRPS